MDEQHRRANAAAAIAGAVAVAAIIATPTLIAQGSEGFGPGPGPGIETPDQRGSVIPSPLSPNRIRIRAAEIHYRFPLAVGWPDDRDASTEELGRDGPSRAIDSLQFRACDASFHEPRYVDRLRADWTDLEDVRSRQLTTYADAGRAAVAVDALDEFFAGCPSEEVDDGFVRTARVVETDEGDQSWALVRQSARAGVSGPGLEIIHVVRIGRAVFVDLTSSDTAGGAATRAAEIKLATMVAAADKPLATMCVYADEGCPSGTPFSNRRRRAGRTGRK